MSLVDLAWSVGVALHQKVRNLIIEYLLAVIEDTDVATVIHQRIIGS